MKKDREKKQFSIINNNTFFHSLCTHSPPLSSLPPFTLSSHTYFTNRSGIVKNELIVNNAYRHSLINVSKKIKIININNHMQVESSPADVKSKGNNETCPTADRTR